MRRVMLAMMLVGFAATAWGFPWDKDMVDQPAEKPQESLAPAEPDAVPVGGTETLPTPLTEAEAFAGKDAAASIPNPVPPTVDSIARGRDF